MLGKFMNTVTLSGYVNSSIKEMGTGKNFGVKFFIRVPRQKTVERNYFPVPVNCWGQRARVVYEALKGKYDSPITVTGKWVTGIKADGTQYYALRMQDFCFGWYDIYDNPKYGEIEKLKGNSLVVDNILENIGDI
jgi:hypothetical protein